MYKLPKYSQLIVPNLKIVTNYFSYVHFDDELRPGCKYFALVHLNAFRKLFLDYKSNV